MQRIQITNELVISHKPGSRARRVSLVTSCSGTSLSYIILAVAVVVWAACMWVTSFRSMAFGLVRNLIRRPIT